MIKKTIYLFINLSIILSQVSNLSMYGSGDLQDSYDAASIGLGGGKFFGENSKGFVMTSPSTYWKSQESHLGVTLKFTNSTFLDNLDYSFSSSNKMSKNNFQFIFFSFPLSETKAFAIGMNPLFRTDIDISEKDYTYIGANEIPEFISDNSLDIQGPMRYKSNYSFTGGISELFLTYSFKITDNISAGCSWYKIFGTSKYKYAVDLYSLSYLDVGGFTSSDFSLNNYILNTQRYSSNRYNLEFKYASKSFDLVSSFTNSKLLEVKLTEETHYLSTISSQTIYNNQGRFKGNSLGFKYKPNNNLNFVSEYHHINPFKLNEELNIFSYQNPDVNSLSFGFSYSVINLEQLEEDKFWDKIDLRMGLYNKSLSYEDFKVSDKGFTLGLGIEYLNKKNFLNFAFKSGKKTSEYGDFYDVRYYNMYITILSGENWFKNERIE